MNHNSTVAIAPQAQTFSKFPVFLEFFLAHVQVCSSSISRPKFTAIVYLLVVFFSCLAREISFMCFISVR